MAKISTMDFAEDKIANFEELLAEARNQIKNCPDPIRIESLESMVFRKFGWSDKKLEEIATKITFPHKIFEIRNYKSIVTQFFNFYFTGKIAESSNIQSTVYSAVSLLNVPDKDGQYRLVFDSEHKELEEKPFFHWIGKHTCAPLEQSPIYADNNGFNYEIQRILQLWNEKTIWLNADQVKLMRLTAFLALALCRIAARNSILLIGAFKSKEFREDLSDYVGWDMEKCFWSPSPECIRRCYELKDDISPIYAIVAYQWIKNRSMKTQPECQLTSNLLYKSLLKGTEGHGIEVINVLKSVLDYTEKTFQELMEIACFIDPEITQFPDWQDLIYFHKIFLDENNPQYSFQWARLIDSAYLQQYTLEENSFVGATLAAILEYKIGQISRQSLWLNLRPRLSRRGLNLGVMIHEIVMDTVPDDDIEEIALEEEKPKITSTMEEDYVQI